MSTTHTIPEGWQKKTLGEIASFQKGLQVPVEQQFSNCEPGMARFVRIVDFTKDGIEQPRYIKHKDGGFNVQDDDVIMIRYGSQTAGKVIKGYTGIIANNMFKITPNEKVVFKSYLFYCLNTNTIQDYLASSQGSTTMPAITYSLISNIIIPVPPLEAQIALDKLFKSMEEKLNIINNESYIINKILGEIANECMNKLCN